MGATKVQHKSWHQGVSFTLADDDEGDSFDVAIFKDNNDMPVFFTRGGRSRCPWEIGTVHRQLLEEDGVTFVQDVTQAAPEGHLINITIQSAGRFDEVMPYSLSQQLESNHNGLRLYLDGAPFIQPVTLHLGPLERTYIVLEARPAPGILDFQAALNFGAVVCCVAVNCLGV